MLIDLSRRNVEKTKMVDKPIKQVKTKYQMLEVIYMLPNGQMIFVDGKFEYHDFVKKYGDLIVCSLRNYDDTKTTSVILRKAQNENER